MKMQKLNQQKVRYHDNMKPRLDNPTFSSSNIWGSMKMPSIQRSQSYSHFGVSKRNFDSEDMKLTIKLHHNKKNIDQQQSSNKSSRSHSRRSQSNLLSYGLNSLQPLKKQINDKDIYQKQAKKFNIVTIQPKQFIDTINLFPKLRLENSDESLYKRMNMEKSMFQSKASYGQNDKTQAIINKKLVANPQQLAL